MISKATYSEPRFIAAMPSARVGAERAALGDGESNEAIAGFALANETANERQSKTTTAAACRRRLRASDCLYGISCFPRFPCCENNTKAEIENKISASQN